MKYILIPDGMTVEEGKIISQELVTQAGTATSKFIESGSSDQYNTIIKYLAELSDLLQGNLTIAHPAKKEDMLTMSQASTYSGFSKSFLYKKTSTNAMNFYKPNGKIIFFKRSDIDDFMSQGKVQSNKEIKQEAQQSLIKTSF